jgi:hypothetical protein
MSGCCASTLKNDVIELAAEANVDDPEEIPLRGERVLPLAKRPPAAPTG